MGAAFARAGAVERVPAVTAVVTGAARVAEGCCACATGAPAATLRYGSRWPVPWGTVPN